MVRTTSLSAHQLPQVGNLLSHCTKGNNFPQSHPNRPKLQLTSHHPVRQLSSPIQSPTKPTTITTSSLRPDSRYQVTGKPQHLAPPTAPRLVLTASAPPLPLPRTTRHHQHPAPCLTNPFAPSELGSYPGLNTIHLRAESPPLSCETSPCLSSKQPINSRTPANLLETPAHTQ